MVKLDRLKFAAARRANPKVEEATNAIPSTSLLVQTHKHLPTDPGPYKVGARVLAQSPDSTKWYPATVHRSSTGKTARGEPMTHAEVSWDGYPTSGHSIVHPSKLAPRLPMKAGDKTTTEVDGEHWDTVVHHVDGDKVHVKYDGAEEHDPIESDHFKTVPRPQSSPTKKAKK